MPNIEKPRTPRGAKRSKGRSITAEEFERMLDKVPIAIDWNEKTEQPRKDRRNVRFAAAWQDFLRSLWASGLRLDEALRLHWEAGAFRVGPLDAPWPRFLIDSEGEKGARDRDLTIDPLFVEMLRKSIPAARRGHVFKLTLWSKGKPRIVRRVDTVSRIIARCGWLAGIKVDENTRTGTVKYASATDLRRSFGDRWSHIPLPLLKHLMRHQSAETTLRFYAGQNSDQLAAEIYRHAAGGKLVDPVSKSASID
jgi:integrase